MCVMSMVHDSYEPRIPDIVVDPPKWIPIPGPATPEPAPSLGAILDLVELRKLIAEFRQVVAAAKLVDEKTGQPDCVDPQKAKLEDRIVELEKLIASPPEFVIVQGGNVEPGRYRVIDGKLYRAVE